MRMATRFAVVVIADFITRDWTTRLPKRHLSLAFENVGLTQAKILPVSIDKLVFVPIMPIPLTRGHKGFENREFVTTAGVASLQKL